METEKKLASIEEICEMIIDVKTAFYNTPDGLLELLAKYILHDKWTKDRLLKSTELAIRTIKKTSISVADFMQVYSENQDRKLKKL